MEKIIIVSRDDIFQEVKLACNIPTVVEAIAMRKIIIWAAAAIGIKVNIEELQQAADNLRLLNKLYNSPDTWAWLREHSLVLDDFKQIVYSNVLSAKLAQYLFADKVEPFFVDHQLDYAKVAMYEVVLSDRDLAWELYFMLIEGKITFAEVAQQYIQDPELRRRKGDRGVLLYKDLQPEISAAVFAATPPQILKPIITSQGVHLILVTEIIQPQLDDVLRSQIMSELFCKWLKQQIQEYEIKQQFD